MPFDDALRRAQQLHAHDTQARERAAERKRAERAAEEDFQESLREFGSWFAAEATSRGLTTVPVYAGEPVLVPPEYKRGFLGFGFKLIPQPRFVPPLVHHGWAIFAQGGERRLSRLGGRLDRDTIVDYIPAYHCLAVDTAGGVRVGLASEDAVYVLPDSQSIESLTRFDLARAAGLIRGGPVGMPFGLNALDPTFAGRESAAIESDMSSARNVLSHYVAFAYGMLGEAVPADPSPESASPPQMPQPTPRPIDHQPMPEDGIQWHVGKPQRLL